jgi:hypothetical protein
MQTRQTGHLTMLHPVVAALRKYGIKARHECPGFVQIKGCDLVFAPSTDHWLWIHTMGNTWTRLLSACMDAELIANTIIAHISAKEAE